MLKRIAAILLVVLSLSLQSCASATASLVSYADNYDGYEFLYPNSWVAVNVTDGPDVVLHDLIEETENVSVVISPVPEQKSLEELGTPTDVGYRLSKNAIAPPDSGRQAELVSAESRQVNGVTYYLLEYVVQLPTQVRHNLASVAVRRNQLYTLNLSTTEKRWEKAEDTFHKVVESFSVY
ncbi:photosystem II reaction center PsbP [Egbenema bharatensis]|uniref:photosystem II reaction center PsbP n=1 Tax=Egbenema bharatensis TaxID=3463334 RepID=UPI003A8A96E4